MKPLKIHILVLLILVAIGGWFFVQNSRQDSIHATLSKLPDRHLSQISVGNKQLTVEVVNRPESITQGLSGRSQLDNDGMVFVLPEVKIPQFWMKEMQFDLDLIWIKEGIVVEVTPFVSKPLPNENLTDLPIYSPHKPVDLVLEVMAGKVEEWQIKKNDTVSIKL